jgi:hypothetical protein
MCYFGLAYIADLQLAVDIVAQTCASGSSQNNLPDSYTDQFELAAFAQHANERMPACSHVMTQSDMPCSLYLAVWACCTNLCRQLQHQPVADTQNKLLSMLPVCFGHQCTRLNVLSF